MTSGKPDRDPGSQTARSPIERREATIIELGQRFPLFGLQPQKYNPDRFFRPFDSSLTLRTVVFTDLSFRVTLGNPLMAPTEFSRSDQLYVVSDLSRSVKHGFISSHDFRASGVLDAPLHYYSLTPEANSVLSRLRLRVYNEDGNIYEARPDKDQLERWGKVQFSKSFYRIQPPIHGEQNRYTLIYHVEDRNELDLVEAEFRLYPGKPINRKQL